MRPGRLIAAVVIAALAGGVGYAAGRDDPAGSPALSSDVESASTASTPATTTTTSIPANPSPSSSLLPSAEDPLTVLSEGLAAWGRFAVSGDSNAVAPWFSRDGPQWGRFQLEVPELSADPLGDPPYRVLVEKGDVSGDAEEMWVEARVTFVRTGEPSQTFRWRIVLRREDDGWRIWTVEEADPYSPTSSIVNP